MLRAKTKQTYVNYKKQRVKDDDYYEDVSTSTDLYLVMCSRLLELGLYDKVEVWYQCNHEHPPGIFEHSTGMKERFFMPEYADYGTDDEPHVLFVRGDLTGYRFVLPKMRSAYKVYYSAGNYYCPNEKWSKWNLVFVDSTEHGKEVEERLKVPVELFRKTCVDKYFNPSSEKDYDVCFVCNAPQWKLKRLLLLKDLALELPDVSFLVLGLTNPDQVEIFKKCRNVHFDGYTDRHRVGEKMARCRVGMVLSGEMDGSPRVIQEFLACGLPVLVSERTTCSHHYINSMTGVISNDRFLSRSLKFLLENRGHYRPREFFEERLSMEVAVDYFVEKLKRHECPINMP